MFKVFSNVSHDCYWPGKQPLSSVVKKINYRPVRNHPARPSWAHSPWRHHLLSHMKTRSYRGHVTCERGSDLGRPRPVTHSQASRGQKGMSICKDLLNEALMKLSSSLFECCIYTRDHPVEGCMIQHMSTPRASATGKFQGPGV